MTSGSTTGADAITPNVNGGDDTADVARPAGGLPDGWFAAASSSTGRVLSGWERVGDDELIMQAKQTAAYAQLARAFARWQGLARKLTVATLRRMVKGQPIDPNDPVTWLSDISHATAVLRRHAITGVDPYKLTADARQALADGQRDADHQAGLDWGTLHPDPKTVDALVRAANTTGLAIDLRHPQVWKWPEDQRRVLADRVGVDPDEADDLSRWTLANPDRFDTGQLRCWRIGSRSWLALAGEQIADVEQVARPVGLFVSPHPAGGWVLTPCVSLDMIRLTAALGGSIGRDLKTVTVPLTAGAELLARMNTNVLHAGEISMVELSTKIMEALEPIFGQRVPVSLSADKRDRWGRLRATRWASLDEASRSAVGAVQLDVMTTTVKGFAVKRVGNARPQHRDTPDSASAAMELGEAVNCAIERGLPLLLSSEAAGLLDGTIRVGRMRGRPGMITITSSDGLEAKTHALSVEQAVGRLRVLRDSATTDEVILDAGAKQVLRMFLAKPLSDDPVLLGRQREVAAVMAVGSGVNAAQTGSGKTVMTCRGAIYQRAVTIPGFRGMLVGEGRLLGQWLDAMRAGAPARGMPPLVPNVRFLRVDERTSIAGQIRAFHRACGDEPGVVLVADSILDRFPGDLKVIDWHLLVADEADRYVNTQTEAHQALRTVRMNAVADCWLLTATPRGKSSEHLDVLVGLAVGDEGMIAERLNVREGGDLMNEVNAHRVRLNYGPHLVRVTRADMQAWMPTVRPAEPIVVEADGALQDLLDAIRDGGQDAYRQLLRVLAQLKTLEKGSDLHKQALVEVSRCQGVVLGNVGVYVDASVDPSSLKHSKAALAQALVRHGLVDAAARGGGDGQPTLRGIVAQAVAGIVADEQVLVFADRVRCLHQLAGTLNDRHHIETHVADGSLKPADFETLKRRFVAGEFPVLCLSKVGQQGHDLQNASTLVQLDLPWTPTGLEQRVGRSARPGNTRGYVQTFIPYIKGGGVEHIVKILAGRGGEHHLLLDSYEGVAASQSTVATQLGAITTQVADSKQDAGYAGTAARLRVAAAVFGA